MAESVVDIILRIRDDAGKVITKTVSDLKELQKTVDGINGGGTSKLGESLQKTGSQAKDASGGLGAFAGVVRGLAPGLEATVSALRVLGGALAAVVSVKAAKDLADVGAKIQVTGTVLRVVANNAGISSTAVTSLDKEIQKLGITAKDSGESITKFIQAGLAGIKGESLGKAKELARAAQDLAVVTGENSSETFSRLITNIQQMDTMGLRFMGLTVDREKAEEKYAQSIGKSASAMTDAEKRQALMNAALVESAKLAGTYDEAMGDAAKQLTSLPRLYNEIAAPISEVLQPAYSALILTFSEFLKEVKALAVEWRNSTDGGLALGDVVKTVATAFKDATVFLLKHADVILKVVEVWAALKIIAVVTGYLTPLLAAAAGATSAFAALSGGLTLLAEVMMARLLPVFIQFVALPIAGALAALVAGATAATAAGGGLVGAITGIRVAVQGLAVSLGPIAIAIAAVGLAWSYLSGAFKSKEQKFVDAAENKKELDKMVGDMMSARATMLQAKKNLSAYTGDDPNEKKALERLAEQSEEEYKLQKIKVDRFAKEHKLQGETLASMDKQKQQEYEITQAVAATTAAVDALKQARQRLGVTDKDGKSDAAQFKQVADDFKSVYDATVAYTTQVAETTDQALARVVNSGKETAASLGEKIKASGLTAEEYIKKFYPPPERLTTWNGLQAAINKGGEAAKIAFEDMSAGFDKLLSEAKSPERIAFALNEVGKYAELLGQRVIAAKETLTFNREKQETDRLSAALGGFTNNLNVLKGAMENVSMLSDTNAKYQAKWKDVMTGLGGSFVEFAGRVIKVNESIQSFSDTTKATSQSSATATRSALAEAQQKYAVEEEAARAALQRRKALAAEMPGDEKAQAARIVAIDKESLAQRIEAAKKHYSTLVQLRDEALNNFKTYSDKVKELDKAIFNLREEKENAIRDIRRKGMSEDEANADKMKEYNELLAKAKEATEQKSYEKAADYARRARELANSAGLNPEEQAQKVAAAYDVQEEALKKQRAEAEKAAKEQLEALKEVSKSVSELSATLTGLTKEQIVSLKPQLDEENLKSILDRVKSEFESLQVTVRVNADTGTTQGFAVGGMVSGPGTETSDSILAALSKNEFVHTARAVRHYGSDFMYAINNMRIPRGLIKSLMTGTLPRFNVGGLVGVPMPAMAAAGVGSVVALDLTFNSRRMGRVTGSRDTVHALVGALKEVSRGT